jgi:hypothetical protein
MLHHPRSTRVLDAAHGVSPRLIDRILRGAARRDGRAPRLD